MNYKEIYNRNYFAGKNSFFYRSGYAKTVDKNPHIFSRYYKDVLKYKSRGKVLDAGCAYGLMLKKFINFQKFGIDISAHAIETARQNVPGASLKVHNLERKFPFKDNSFDVVLLLDVLEHLKNPLKALGNAVRCLKPGGIIYISTPNKNTLRKLLFYFPDKKENHISMFKRDELEKAAKLFNVDVLEKYTLTPISSKSEYNDHFGVQLIMVAKK